MLSTEWILNVGDTPMNREEDAYSHTACGEQSDIVLKQISERQWLKNQRTQWRISSLHAMKAHIMITLVLDGQRWSALCPGHLTWGETPSTHCIGGWVVPSAGLDILE